MGAGSFRRGFGTHRASRATKADMAMDAMAKPFQLSSKLLLMVWIIIWGSCVHGRPCNNGAATQKPDTPTWSRSATPAQPVAVLVASDLRSPCHAVSDGAQPVSCSQ